MCIRDSLEAMAESQVTIDGTQYDLKHPFLVIATQNPNGFEGTFPLPESQMDRFLLRLSMNYPDAESETDLLLDQPTDDHDFRLEPVMHRDDMVALQTIARNTNVDRKIAKYIVELVSATRTDTRIRVGCSPRGSKMLLRAAKARAVLMGRDFVLPDDIQALAVPSMAHRISTRNLSTDSEDAEIIVRDILNQTEVPV